MTKPTSRNWGRARLCLAIEVFLLSITRHIFRHVPFAFRALRYGTVIGVLFSWSLTVRADDYERYDFSLRLPAAFTRFSSYASVAAVGSAQAASEWSSSINPASAAWPHIVEVPYPNSLSPQFSALQFDEGTDVYVAAEAAALNAGKWGVFVPAAAQVWSNHEQTSEGLGFEFNADYFQVPWGKLIAEDWAVGVNLNYMATDTRFDILDAKLVRTRIDDYGVRLGVLHRSGETLRVGMTVDYGYAPAWTDRFDPFGLGTGTVHSKDITQRVVARPGIAWQYTPHEPRGNLYADYQVGVFWNDTGTLWVHRFPVGIEYWLVPGGWIARMGTTVDTRGSAALTAGTGVAISRRAFVNIAYQYGMFPELRPEFGPAQTFALSLVVGF